LLRPHQVLPPTSAASCTAPQIPLKKRVFYLCCPKNTTFLVENRPSTDSIGFYVFKKIQYFRSLGPLWTPKKTVFFCTLWEKNLICFLCEDCTILFLFLRDNQEEIRIKNSVVDPYYFISDPDPQIFSISDPDPSTTLN